MVKQVFYIFWTLGNSNKCGRRHCSAKSVATWSFRGARCGAARRPGRGRPVRADSRLPVDILEHQVQGGSPAATSRRRALEPGHEGRRRRRRSGCPARPRPRTWAIEPVEVVERQLRVDLDRAGEVGPAARHSSGSAPSLPAPNRTAPHSHGAILQIYTTGSQRIIRGEPVPPTCNGGAGQRVLDDERAGWRRARLA